MVLSLLCIAASVGTFPLFRANQVELIEMVEHSTESFAQRTTQALGGLRTGKRLLIEQSLPPTR
jgi:hypothetical protein